MAESIGVAAGGHPNLNLTAEEKRVYGQLLREADPDGFGAVSGDVAVKFFEKTKLPPDVLGQIWQIADNENRGFLTPSGFGVVLRLIGHAQAGRVPVASIAPQPAPLPRFEGAQPAPAPISIQTTGTPASPTQLAPPPIRVPALSPEKVAEYSALFDKSGAEQGLLFGGTAKQIFERAKLPNEVLGRIWSLSDTQSRGQLDVTEFVIAMHLLASYKSGAMRGVPGSLPPGLYDAAARRPTRVGSGARPGSASGPSAAGIFPQTTGFNQRPQSPITRAQAGTPLSSQSTGDWAITAADNARFDQIFSSVDTQGLGFVTGDQAVGFFGNARLPEETLAQIWDLADIDSEGRLDRDEFAIAMYLIRQQRGTKDGRGNLPTVLPPSLIPPSRRKQQIPPSQPTAPAFENAPVTQPRTAADDLFGLDVLSSPQPAVPQVAQSTGGTEISIFGSGPSVQTTGSTAATSIFRPFEPSSSFGRSLAPQATGSPAVTQNRAIPATILENEDLLGDNDIVQSQKLTNDTAELGNLSNQVGNLSRQMTELQGNRSQAEQELSQTAHQKRAFESRLAQLRSAYDKEVQEFKALQDQLTSSRNETKRLQQDMAMIEGSHSDLQVQHQQLRAAFETDQRENMSLKERIRQLNAEVEQLKPQLTKIQSDARQQKGLVAINKKQLATNEAERDRIRAEIEAASTEHQTALQELEETNRGIETHKAEHESITMALEEKKRHIEAARTEHTTITRDLEERRQHLEAARRDHEVATRDLGEKNRQIEASKRELEAANATPAPAFVETKSPPAVASPAASFTSNPFARRGPEATFSPPIGSPEPTQEAQSAFDNIFGPSFGAASSGPPPTSFRNEAVPTASRELSDAVPHRTMSPVIPGTPQVEPPAPPAARQVTSDQLPFRAPLERTGSLSSSVQVVAPASRVSPADTPRALTPADSTPSPPNHFKAEHDPFSASAADEEQGSVRQAVNRSLSADKMSDIPGAFPDSETPAHETSSFNINPTAIAVGAGAAALAAGAGLAAAVTYKPDETESHAATETSKATASRPDDFDMYFGGPAHQRTPSEQVKDFDSAFAAMRSAPVGNSSRYGLSQEFPDIQEIVDDDDDSSTDAEEAPLGFDDDFGAPGGQKATVAAPTAAVVSPIAAEKKPEAPPAIPAYLQARPPFESAPSTASSLPDIEREISPPNYKSVVPNDNPAHFPLEYKGLLPERTDPTSAQPEASGSQHDPPLYGPEAARSQDEAFSKVAHEATTTSPSAKPTAFDFDSAFAGVGTAQVDDDSSDEDESTFRSVRGQSTEFDPTFDSPAPPSRVAPVTSSTQSPSIYQSVTASSGSGINGSTNNSYNFSNPAAAATSTTQPAAPPVSHDWDALFAPLSTSTATVDSSSPTTATQAPTETKSITTSVPSTESAPTPPPPRSGTNTSLKPQRPEPGRALSEGTEHDDPILTRLTAMGWSRTESLAALEKFDYNIDKAADYLTFRS